MNIWAVGRNYKGHAKEMNAAIPSEPMFFLKSGNCLVVGQNEIIIPSFTQDLHYETELLILLGPELQPAVGAVALDLTLRDRQQIAKNQGLPWTLAKSFINSCPCSPFFPLPKIEEIPELKIQLTINNEIKQSASLSELIFDVPTLIKYLKVHFPVQPGDFILTGTPEGVGRLNPGDQLLAECIGKTSHTWLVS